MMKLHKLKLQFNDLGVRSFYIDNLSNFKIDILQHGYRSESGWFKIKTDYNVHILGDEEQIISWLTYMWEHCRTPRKGLKEWMQVKQRLWHLKEHFRQLSDSTPIYEGNAYALLVDPDRDVRYHAKEQYFISDTNAREDFHLAALKRQWVGS